MRLIDGRAIAAAIAEEVTAAVTALRGAGTVPSLAVVVPTRDEAAAWYVRSLARAAGKVGVACRIDELDEPDAAQLAKRLDALSGDPGVHGIVC